ncbi:mycofactocin precursor [Nocardioides sp. BGMRC 2183]|nr:mycofactocin precursor [Nocardioides sp. BGMRC 2183]
MSLTCNASCSPQPGGVVNPEIDAQDELAAEDLIEEVSIDGMCGVY